MVEEDLEEDIDDMLIQNLSDNSFNIIKEEPRVGHLSEPLFHDPQI